MPYAHTRFTVRSSTYSHEIGSGGVPAGADPGSIGWNRPTGATIHCSDTGDDYSFDGTNWDQELNVNSTFSDAADSLDAVSQVFTAPAAPSDTAVHAGFAGNDASNNFPGLFTNPGEPRRLRFVFGAGWDGGDITPTGTDARDAVATETITNPGAGGGTVLSTKAYKTVTAATKGAVGVNAATCSIGTDVGLGLTTLPTKAGSITTVSGATQTEEVGAWDMTNGVVEPTTVENGALDFVISYLKTGATSTVTATP